MCDVNLFLTMNETEVPIKQYCIMLVLTKD